MRNSERTQGNSQQAPLLHPSAPFPPGARPFTRLIGREQELHLLHPLLQRPAVRLLTLTGPAGVGKTRLAQQLLAELQPAFPDGGSFVSLAPIRDADQVLPQFLQTFGVAPAEDGSFLEQLHLLLQHKHCLVVLDNFEQVVAAGPQLVNLLAACSGLKLLITSRAVLRVQGEYEFAVSPLTVPDPSQMPGPEHLAQYPALALFLERAQQVKHDFVLTEDNASTIAEICARLDGLPLALELAAARLKLFSPAVLLGRLKQRLEILTNGPEAPSRHQTLRTALAWSYDLLSPQEQRLFRSLAVFVGSFSLEAVEFLGMALGGMPPSLLDGITALLDQSLLQHAAPAASEPRFALLEMLREYGLEQLEALGELAAARNAHAAYYQTLVEDGEFSFVVLPQGPHFTRLLQNHANLRAALEWLLERREIEAALRLAVGLGELWRQGPYGNEGQRFLEQITEAAQELPVPVVLQARALTILGHMELWKGDLSQSAQPLEEALRLFEHMGDRRGSAVALSFLSILAEQGGQLQRAAALREEGLRRCRAAGTPAEVAHVLLSLGITALFAGQFERVQQWCEESLSMYQQLRVEWGIAANLHYLGWAAACQEAHEHARALEEESIARFRAIGGPAPLMEALVVLACERALLKDYQAASTLLEESLALGRKRGHPVIIARALWGLGLLARLQGQQARARALYEQSVLLLVEKPRPSRVWWVTAAGLEGLGTIACAEGQAHKAILLLSAAQALRTRDGTWNPVGFEQRLSDDTQAAARVQLGEATVAALWATGQMMTPEQALEHRSGS